MSPSRSPLIRALQAQDADYLRDESRLAGRADSISLPSSEGEVREVLRATGADRTPVTVQGGRTGIVGGAVPQGGHVLNLGRMDRILDPSLDPDPNADPGCRLLRVQPGLPLVRLNEWLQSVSGGLFFPPDPTESTAPWAAWPAPTPPGPGPWPTAPCAGTCKPCAWSCPTARR